MANDHRSLPLTKWRGDVGSLLTEMKRRAAVPTDRELARFMGVAQATVSYWRTRGQVPEAAILKFERMLTAGGHASAERLAAARAIALRVPEFWYQRALKEGVGGGRAIFYRAASENLHLVVDAAAAQLERYQRQTGQGVWDLAAQLMEDERLLEGLVEVLKRAQ